MSVNGVILMSDLLVRYAAIVGDVVIDHLKQLARPLKGMKVVHINSTREGGGVAEILNWLIPLKTELGMEVEWDVITGNREFYQCTKSFHNALQGSAVGIPLELLSAYEQTNAVNSERMRRKLEEADFVFIHDPQPAPLLHYCPNRRGKWIWRCHIDLSHPYRAVWKYMQKFVFGYDASVWSLADFARPMPHPLYLIAPSIDPLSPKNIELAPDEVNAVYDRHGLNPDLPLITQVSRFDHFKDPLGVIAAYRLVKSYIPIQLVLAGGGATDDPEGDQVLREVQAAGGNDPDIHVLLLPADAHREINALQRASTICLQKSVKEGFGLTVTEAMWKGKPVIGGDTGGIRLQVINHHTGFLVNTPEGAALRIRYLLKKRNKMEEIGDKAKEFVLRNFLVTRQLSEYLTLMLAIKHQSVERIEM
jgi:trehalose synthase